MLEAFEVPASGDDSGSGSSLVLVEHVESCVDYDRVVIWHKGKWIADVPVTDANG
jgi:hypothetical protein